MPARTCGRFRSRPTPVRRAAGKSASACSFPSALESRIARIIETRRRILIYGRPGALFESVVVEVVDEAVGELQREEWFPAKAVVQRQTRRCLPRVLHVSAQVPLPHVIVIGHG